MPHQELIEATNELFKLRARGAEASIVETVAVLELSCVAITGLLDDVEMARSIDRIAAERRAPSFTPDDGAAIEELCKSFLKTEPEVLHAVGLSDGAIRSLMDAGEETLKACATGSLDVAQLYASLIRLERRICGRVAQVRKIAEEKEGRGAVARFVSRAAVGVGGAAAVAANAGAIVVIPITTSMAAMSLAFGGVLVGSAIGAPWDG